MNIDESTKAQMGEIYQHRKDIQEYAIKCSRLRRLTIVILSLVAIFPNICLLFAPNCILTKFGNGIIGYEFFSCLVIFLIFSADERYRYPAVLKILPKKDFVSKNLSEENPALYDRLMKFRDTAINTAHDNAERLKKITKLVVEKSDCQALAKFIGTDTISFTSGLLCNFPDDEIEALFAHELGHAIFDHNSQGRKNHDYFLWLNLIFITLFFVSLFIFAFVCAAYLMLVIASFGLVWILFVLFSGVCRNGYIAKTELDADGYAISELNSAIIFENALRRSADVNSLVYDYSTLDQWLITGYPSVKKRIELACKVLQNKQHSEITIN